MSFTLIHRDDCETAGNWTLVRRTLDLQSFGVNLVDLAPGEQIPEHDETVLIVSAPRSSGYAPMQWA
jgi:hypothetical protein